MNKFVAGYKDYRLRGLIQPYDPYATYSILDKKNNRILVLEGFCYAPSKEKRDLIHELESIIKSVVVAKR